MPSFQLSGWLLIGAIIAATALWLLGIFSLEIYQAALGIIGVGGIAGLRALINSSGSKTYILAIAGAAAVVLFSFGLITQENFTIIMTGILGLQAVTMGAAVNKTPDKSPAIKKVA